MQDKSYTIHQRRPYRCLLFILLSSALSAVACWFVAQLWHQQQIQQLALLQQQQQTLSHDNAQLTKANQALRASLNSFSQQGAIKAATDEQLSMDVQRLQNKVLELNKELQFYQDITQGDSSSQLQIRELHVSAVAAESNSYVYRLVLTQGARVEKPTEGIIELSLRHGDGDNVTSRLVASHEMKLRHVQVIEGTITLEDEEQAPQWQVQIKRDNTLLSERLFDWGTALSPAL